MANLVGLASFVAELKARRTSLVDELHHVDESLEVLGKFNAGSNHTQPKRIVSAASRRKMALAQKARWAGLRKESQSVSAPAKRTMSAAGRKRIAAAQRRRWAKVRAGKK